MKRFTYRLEPVLRLRKQELRMAEWKQLEARRQVDDAVRQLEESQGRLARATEALSQRMGATMPAGEYLGQQDRVQAIQREIAARGRRLAAAQQVWQAASDRRSQLAVQVETLEHLRSLQREEHRRAVEAKKQQQLDEFAVRRWSASSRDQDEVNPHA
jgi:flagellar export protein FliJ